jgi:hypothetical protein
MSTAPRAESVLPEWPCIVQFRLPEWPNIFLSKRENVPNGADITSDDGFGLVAFDAELTAAWIEQRGGWTADEQARLQWVADHRPEGDGNYGIDLDRITP